jgi:hypothetical protein
LQAPFGYTRKDVLLIGVGLKSGLEVSAPFVLFPGLVHLQLLCQTAAHDSENVQLLGVDPLQAGNVVQLLVVLGMTVGWISTYMFRVANKDMTHAHQLRDYEKQVMEVT